MALDNAFGTALAIGIAGAAAHAGDLKAHGVVAEWQQFCERLQQENSRLERRADELAKLVKSVQSDNTELVEANRRLAKQLEQALDDNDLHKLIRMLEDKVGQLGKRLRRQSADTYALQKLHDRLVDEIREVSDPTKHLAHTDIATRRELVLAAIAEHESRGKLEYFPNPKMISR